jgi:hypothetical protein
VFHPTARRLDEPYKLYGFTIPQCVALVLGGGGVIAALHYLHVGVQAGGLLGTLVIGVPALYWLLGESGRIEPGELVLDALAKLLVPARYEPGAGGRTAEPGVTAHAREPDRREGA